MSGEPRIPPNLLVADFASGQGGDLATAQSGQGGQAALLQCQGGLLLCRGQIAPGGPSEEGGLCCGLSGHSWSAPSSAHFLALLSVCVCVHLYLIRVPGRACAGPNGHFGQRSGRLLYHTSSSSSVHLYLCTSVIHMPTRVLA